MTLRTILAWLLYEIGQLDPPNVPVGRQPANITYYPEDDDGQL